MVLKKVEDLKGGEILARNIMTWDYQILLPEGITVRKEYIAKLKDLGIKEIYIKKETKTDEIAILKSEMKDTIRETVKDILERHTYQKNEELSELNSAADSILSTILEEDKVVEKVFDIKERSADIYEHSISICSMAILTALKLKVEIGRIRDIGIGCLLHDIGLRYTTVDYNNKDMDKLSKQEITAYKKHSIYGYSSLKDEPWISDRSKAIILYHHERMDGSGFPLRIKDIPLECRIVNVCDAFDEMICGIACERKKVYEAIEFMNNYKGKMFDQRIVDVFLSFTAVYPSGTIVLTSEGETAVVLSQNKDFKDRPVLRILKDKDGNEVKGEVIKDLLKIYNLFIEKALD